jgi:hypothetical protein
MGVHASRPVLDSPEVLEAIYTFIWDSVQYDSPLYACASEMVTHR